MRRKFQKLQTTPKENKSFSFQLKLYSYVKSFDFGSLQDDVAPKLIQLIDLLGKVSQRKYQPYPNGKELSQLISAHPFLWFKILQDNRPDKGEAFLTTYYTQQDRYGLNGNYIQHCLEQEGSWSLCTLFEKEIETRASIYRPIVQKLQDEEYRDSFLFIVFVVYMTLGGYWKKVKRRDSSLPILSHVVHWNYEFLHTKNVDVFKDYVVAKQHLISLQFIVLEGGVEKKIIMQIQERNGEYSITNGSGYYIEDSWSKDYVYCRIIQFEKDQQSRKEILLMFLPVVLHSLCLDYLSPYTFTGE
jgi:hypothetical protein